MAKRALIVGAGIGGLAAGRALRGAGFEVKILERAATLEPLGAGISLWPNATRALRRLGLVDISAAGAEPTAGGIRRFDGRMLASVEPKTIESRYGAPLLLLHRATLQRALLADGVEETVDTGSEVIRVDEEGDEILAETSEGTQLHGDLLIGADGLQSKVRSSLLGDDPLRHSGLLGYRATVEWKGPIKAGEYWGDGVAFGLVPIDGERVYWFATKRTRGGEPPEDDPIPGLIERFERWAPELISVISATPPTAVLRHDLYDRPPSTPWVQGRIALLGDAAHPMLPFLGQGACQAIEDAEVIGETLTTGSSVPNALKAYEKQRKPRATRAVRASRQMGRMIHLRPAPLRVVRDRVVSLTPEGMRLRQLDAVVGRP